MSLTSYWIDLRFWRPAVYPDILGVNEILLPSVATGELMRFYRYASIS